MAIQKAMISSNTNEWETPVAFFNKLNKEFGFTLDPCSTNENAKCKKHFTIKDNGLLQNWNNDIIFMNPPYGGQTGRWIQKAYNESLKGAVVVCLIVSATDRSYWHEFIFPFASEIRWIRGRLRFKGGETTAPFANAIIIFDNKKKDNKLYTYYSRLIPKTRLLF